MKKTFAILIALVLVLSLAVNAAAAGSQSIVLGNARFTEKDEVQTIAIEANNFDALSVVQVVVSYDSEKVELLDVIKDGENQGIVEGAAGDNFNGATVSSPVPGIVIFVWEYAEAFSGSGVIANLRFKALSDDVGVVKLSDAEYENEKTYVCRDDADKIPRVVEIDVVEAPSGATVSGTVTSYLDGEETITVGLYEGENAEPSYQTIVTGNSTEYSIPEVAAGNYIMKVSKINHATREYEVVVVTDDVEQDVKIHPIGDINGDGKIVMVDYLRARQHAQSVQLLTGYEFTCADINGDSKVVMVDYMRIRQHAQNISKLW